MIQITAELKDWSREKWYGNLRYVAGRIYSDSKNRWPDGTRISTSYIKEVLDRDDHYLFITKNSIYKCMKNSEVPGGLKISKSE